MKLKLPDQISIMECNFKVKYNPYANGGKFNLYKGKITIGVECINKDPDYTFMVICHEVSEIIHVLLHLRYDDPNVGDNYKFFMDHKEFSTHNAIFSKAIQQFIQ